MDKARIITSEIITSESYSFTRYFLKVTHSRILPKTIWTNNVRAIKTTILNGCDTRHQHSGGRVGQISVSFRPACLQSEF